MHDACAPYIGCIELWNSHNELQYIISHHMCTIKGFLFDGHGSSSSPEAYKLNLKNWWTARSSLQLLSFRRTKKYYIQIKCGRRLPMCHVARVLIASWSLNPTGFSFDGKTLSSTTLRLHLLFPFMFAFDSIWYSCIGSARSSVDVLPTCEYKSATREIKDLGWVWKPKEKGMHNVMMRIHRVRPMLH